MNAFHLLRSIGLMTWREGWKYQRKLCDGKPDASLIEKAEHLKCSASCLKEVAEPVSIYERILEPMQNEACRKKRH